jgi:hypothetical protein
MSKKGLLAAIAASAGGETGRPPPAESTLEAMAIDDFRDSINTHFWGPVFRDDGRPRILRGCVRGEGEVVLSVPAEVAVTFNALCPGDCVIS